MNVLVIVGALLIAAGLLAILIMLLRRPATKNGPHVTVAELQDRLAGEKPDSSPGTRTTEDTEQITSATTDRSADEASSKQPSGADSTEQPGAEPAGRGQNNGSAHTDSTERPNDTNQPPSSTTPNTISDNEPNQSPTAAASTTPTGSTSEPNQSTAATSSSANEAPDASSTAQAGPVDEAVEAVPSTEPSDEEAADAGPPKRRRTIARRIRHGRVD